MSSGVLSQTPVHCRMILRCLREGIMGTVSSANRTRNSEVVSSRSKPGSIQSMVPIISPRIVWVTW